MKTIFAVTHGSKAEGPNPELTGAGVAEIRAAAAKLFNREVTCIIVGTGLRFIHTHTVINTVFDLGGLPVKYSPLLGSADSGKKAETGFDVLLADGTPIHDSGYIGLIGTPGVDLWAFLAGAIPDGSLLVTGREFIGSFLGGANNAKSATVYQITIDDDAGTGGNTVVEI